MVLLVAVALRSAAPWLPLADPDAVDTAEPASAAALAGHALGTDEFGRDLLSRPRVGRARVAAGRGGHRGARDADRRGARESSAGYYTGWVETLVMRLTDILMAFPYILLAIAIVAGPRPRASGTR